MAANGFAIDIHKLTYNVTDRRGKRLEILKETNLSIRDGEFIAIIGPSGCGKSTLLNFVSGLLPIESGSVSLFGKPVEGVHPSIGYMFQHHALLPWRNVQANVELGLEIGGCPKKERQERALEKIAQLGLRGFESRYPNELSGGMRQRVSLARMLVDEPQLILMDEPFGALDAQTKLLIQEMFLESWEAKRRTVVFVTHDLAEAVALSDRVVLMSARPARIKAEYVIDIPRPRDLNKLAKVPRFADLVEEIWSGLREEALAAMQGAA